MASGHKKRPLALKLNLKEKRHHLDKPAPVRVLVRDGVTLETPEILSNAEDISIANRLRQEAPRSEWILRPALLAMGFQHSVPMFGYFLDFYHPSLKVCVEIDGSVHRNRKAADRTRDRRLTGYGIETYRYRASRVYSDPESIIRNIRNIIELKTPIRDGSATS